VDTPHPSTLLKAKKAFGQNFLVNEGAIRTIISTALASPAKALLEIGPGPGVLTAPLLADGRPLWAVDLDPEAIAVLESRFGDQPHFHLLQGDAVRIPWPEGGPFAVVGNLPYNAATPILTRLLLEPFPWERLVLMFQLEVGQKINGHPGTKDYGPLSVLAQTCTRVTRLMKLGPGSFRPSPKVDSAVLLFELKADAPSFAQRAQLLDLLHRAFANRRKTLSNNLRQPGLDAALEASGLSPSLRAEAVSPAQWLTLLAHLQESNR
jgi:16S rRNA (adenine1518-N6/adenine1519-N6)-dimethyltransferase